MARKKKIYPLLEGFEITELAAEGKALGRYGDLVVFVPMAVPGDIVDVQVNSKRKRFMEGFIVRYVKKSPLREEPFCSHYGECGGCKWQSLPYSEQLKFKQQQVYDQLSRIGRIELPEVSPIIGSAKTTYYRNKLEFTFSCSRWLSREVLNSGAEVADRNGLGFHVPGMFDKVVDISHCYLQGDPSNAIRLAVREVAVSHGMTFYNMRTHEGLLRNLVVRTSTTGDVMVIVVFAKDDTENIELVMSHLSAKFPEITSLMYVVNGKMNDTIGDLEIKLYSGADHIFEEMEGLRFKIGPKSFYQTNSEQAYNLYRVARDFADLKGGEVVYDLYTGTGTIANFVALGCSKVVGIEYVDDAIKDARVNSEINGIDNTVFYSGDMKDVLTPSFIEANGRPDVIILDPPRAGIHGDVAEAVLQAAPAIIVYVSCNPATQARDLAIFDGDYKVTAVQPVDMFPHTHHVENVVKLVRR